MAQITVEFEGGDEVTDVFGALQWTPSARHLDEAAVVLPTPFRTTLTVSPQVITVPLSEPWWCWQVRELVPGGTLRHVQVTGDSAYSALLDVDPATLEPTAVPPAAWVVAVQALQAGVDAAEAGVAASAASAAAAAASAAEAKVPGPQGIPGEPGADSTVPGPEGPQGPPGTDGVTPSNAAIAALAPVQSVATRTGAVVLSKADVGLPAVDNTADAAKPISAAQAAAFVSAAVNTKDAPGLGLYFFEAHGATADQAADQTAAVNATFAAVQAAGGGTIMALARTYLCLGALMIPNNGAASPVQKPLTIRGAGVLWNSYLTGVGATTGGTIFDLRYNGVDGLHTAKFDTRGGGAFEMSNVTISSGGTDNLPLFQTTNTTVKIRDCAFLGNPANTGPTCVQDAVLLGGTNWTNTMADPNHAFQGYGSVVENNFFARIRTCVAANFFANSTRIFGNTVGATCGSPDAAHGAFQVLGDTGAGKTTDGVVIRDNLIEMTGYSGYGIVMDYATRCIIDGNQFWDAGAGVLGGVYLSATCILNTLTDGLNRTGKPFVVEATPGSNMIVGLTSSGGGTYGIQTTAVRFGTTSACVNMGNLGTTHTYVSAAESALANVPLHIRAKGTSAVLVDSHLSVEGNLPTTTAQAGTTAMSVVGSDNAGKVTFTTAAGVVADLPVAQITFSVPFSTTPFAAVICPMNAAAAAAQGWVKTIATNVLQIALHTPPAAATPMIFSWMLLGAGN